MNTISKKELNDLKGRLKFWEDTAKRNQKSSDYYCEELQKSHTLIGRIIHQHSERWDSVNLTKYFPTDNLWNKRTINNPSGGKEK